MFAGGKGGKDAFTSGVVGSVLHEAGVELHAQMKSAAGAKFAFAGSQLARGKEPMWPVKELPRQREVPPPPCYPLPCIPCLCPSLFPDCSGAGPH